MKTLALFAFGLTACVSELPPDEEEVQLIGANAQVVVISQSHSLVPAGVKVDLGGVTAVDVWTDPKIFEVSDWDLQLAAKTLPACDLSFAAGDVFVERNVELLDQVGTVTLDKPGHIFGEVFAGLGDEIAKTLEHLIAHAVPLRHAPFFDDLADAWIEVFDMAVEMALKA